MPPDPGPMRRRGAVLGQAILRAGADELLALRRAGVATAMLNDPRLALTANALPLD